MKNNKLICITDSYDVLACSFNEYKDIDKDKVIA